MRTITRDFVQLCTNILPVTDPIYDFGSLQVPEQKKAPTIRSLFPGRKYIGTDLRPGLEVDAILDLHNLSLLSRSLGTALLIDTLEHVEYPRKAIEEIHRVLKQNGVLILTTVLNFEIHPEPDDFWRFTPSGIQSLLKLFPFSYVLSVGKPRFPHTILAVANKVPPNQSLTSTLSNQLAHFRDLWNAKT